MGSLGDASITYFRRSSYQLVHCLKDRKYLVVRIPSTEMPSRFSYLNTVTFHPELKSWPVEITTCDTTEALKILPPNELSSMPPGGRTVFVRKLANEHWAILCVHENETYLCFKPENPDGYANRESALRAIDAFKNIGRRIEMDVIIEDDDPRTVH